MTGYNRCYRAYLLRHQDKRIRLSPNRWWWRTFRKAGGQRVHKYDQKVLKTLTMIWEILDLTCFQKPDQRKGEKSVWLPSLTEKVDSFGGQVNG
jgi:hypothetical protein